jgi:hypothetical protein
MKSQVSKVKFTHTRKIHGNFFMAQNNLELERFLAFLSLKFADIGN